MRERKIKQAVSHDLIKKPGKQKTLWEKIGLTRKKSVGYTCKNENKTKAKICPFSCLLKDYHSHSFHMALMLLPHKGLGEYIGSHIHSWYVGD